MASSIFPLVIFLALFISVGATTTTSSSRISEPLLSACKQTPEPETCIKYLRKFPRSSMGNIQNITAFSVRAASFMAKEIHSFISILRKEDDFGIPVFERCLDSSTVAIGDIIGKLDELTKAIQDRNFIDVGSWIADAWTDIATAEESCTGDDGQPEIPQLSGYMDELSKLLRIISVFSKLIGN